jgi:arthrofactin-type cyclic lipopeptide synthetase C
VLAIGKADGRILGGLNYAIALFDHATVVRYTQYLRMALSEMARGDRQAASEVALLSAAERQKLLVEWNAT